MSDTVEDALSSYAKVLNAEFQSTRDATTDSDVKGGANEKLVADFISGLFKHWSVFPNCQIINSKENKSDECDICVCNQHQYFAHPNSRVVVAEGVDFVVQVKAQLDDDELDRAIKNCVSVKSCVRHTNLNDKVRYRGVLTPEVYEKIPYIVFAFSSKLKIKTLTERLKYKCRELDNERDQVDAVFVLDRGISIFNGAIGLGVPWFADGKKINDFVALDTGESTLFEFIRFCIDGVPKVEWFESPSSQYFVPGMYEGYFPSQHGTAKKKRQTKKKGMAKQKKKPSKKK